MIENEKSTHRKFRIGIIDFLVIITFVACISGLFLHFRIFEKNNELTTTDTCYVSVMLYGVDNNISEKIALGDKIYLKEQEEPFGTVLNIVKEDACVYYTNTKNEILKSADNSKKDVALTLEVNGDLSQDGFLTNGVKFIASGMELDIYSQTFSGKCLVFGIEQYSE